MLRGSGNTAQWRSHSKFISFLFNDGMVENHFGTVVETNHCTSTSCKKKIIQIFRIDLIWEWYVLVLTNNCQHGVVMHADLFSHCCTRSQILHIPFMYKYYTLQPPAILCKPHKSSPSPMFQWNEPSGSLNIHVYVCFFVCSSFIDFHTVPLISTIVYVIIEALSGEDSDIWQTSPTNNVSCLLPKTHWS